MKKLILDALKAKFSGVSEAILNRMAEKLAKTVTKEDDVAAAVEAVTFQQVIDSESDRRATEATNTAIVNYEKKHSLKEGKPVTGGEQGNEHEPAGGNQVELPEDTPAWAKVMVTQNQELVKANKTLADRLASLEGDKVTSSRRQQLDTVIGSASDKFKTRITKNYERMAFKDDEDYNAWLEEIKTEAEEDAADTTAAGAVFGRPKFGQQPPKDEVPKHIQDYLDGKDKAEGQAF
ncbi:hypothetical protein LJC39_03295 [Parabacteroides sp. OttesenSCG-928-B22]|nr:hypothetical protein [Parabacteroides sp. OttesenSCG-928-B22]